MSHSIASGYGNSIRYIIIRRALSGKCFSGGASPMFPIWWQSHNDTARAKWKVRDFPTGDTANLLCILFINSEAKKTKILKLNKERVRSHVVSLALFTSAKMCESIRCAEWKERQARIENLLTHKRLQSVFRYERNDVIEGQRLMGFTRFFCLAADGRWHLPALIYGNYAKSNLYSHYSFACKLNGSINQKEKVKINHLAKFVMKLSPIKWAARKQWRMMSILTRWVLLRTRRVLPHCLTTNFTRSQAILRCFTYRKNLFFMENFDGLWKLFWIVRALWLEIYFSLIDCCVLRNLCNWDQSEKWDAAKIIVFRGALIELYSSTM